MQLLEIEIQNVRGIRDLSLEPQGRNLVIWGPNGSGKSAVVDAIDFLLTGRISRLTGKGTGGITLGRHGPHIDHDPQEAVVRAVLSLPAVDEPVTVARCMQHPNELECDARLRPLVEPVMRVAKRGQHALTRREILKYITAEPSTRAQEIQTLLDVTEIEAIRRSFVRVKNRLRKRLEAAKASVNEAKGAVSSTAQTETFSEDAILAFVNRNREVLDGDVVSSLNFKLLKEELKPPTTASAKEGVNVTLFERNLGTIRDALARENQIRLAERDAQLRASLSTVREDPDLVQALERQELLELGLQLIDETGDCPLCSTSWHPGELRKKLEKEISSAKIAQEHQSRISRFSENIEDSVNVAMASVEEIKRAAESIGGLEDEAALFKSWISDLKELSVALSAPAQKYPLERFSTEHVQRLLAPEDIAPALEQAESSAKKVCPEVTPEQTAWDALTRLGENLKRLEKAVQSFESSKSSYLKAEVLLDSFESARDRVLGALYDDVRDRFVDLYRQLHGPDEEGFTARLEPEGPGLDLEVDFHDRGQFPPHALHSEGHQDSMGLCLYLALAEELTKGTVDLLVLDDVMMSVDSGHRRRLCQLLGTSFPDRQLLITTHDKTWANQLKYEGVASSKRTIEFFSWDIDTGPRVSCEAGMWDRIADDLEANDVPSAAARLRRGSEGFFAAVCDSLGADVTYKLSGRWELGDFLPAAMSRYGKLLRKAKVTAQSWGHQQAFEKLNELDSIRGQIFARSNVEQWAINTNVHYNSWADFTREDFQPVVEAFQDLYGLFLCNGCGGMLRVLTDGPDSVAVRCNCGKVNWNLREK